jgi:hypothetical protein
LQQAQFGAQLVEHMLLNLGSWEPLGGIGLSEIILTGACCI